MCDRQTGGGVVVNFGKSIRIFLMDNGMPSGRWSCELSNWTGKAYKIPRNKVIDCSDRPDLLNTGIYFLIGRDEDEKELIYIGESDSILNRLKQHLDKDYWTECIVFISKDDFLNKAHIKYMENRFHNMAVNAKRYIIMNAGAPTKSSLSKADIAELEEFMYNARLIVNILGFRAFEPLLESSEKNDIETLSLSVAGIYASGRVTSEGFVVLAGSSICKNPAPSMIKTLARRAQLTKEGKIDENNKLEEDILFSSPSAAASFVLGYSVSGPATWKNYQGKTLGVIESTKKEGG